MAIRTFPIPIFDFDYFINNFFYFGWDFRLAMFALGHPT